MLKITTRFSLLAPHLLFALIGTLSLPPATAIAASFCAADAICVQDGDTFIWRSQIVRIANIDTPETIKAKCDAERRLGGIAKRRLAALLDDATDITVRPGDPRDGRTHDRHGRLLATVSVDGKDLGETLISEDLARPWSGRRSTWCSR